MKKISKIVWISLLTGLIGIIGTLGIVRWSPGFRNWIAASDRPEDLRREDFYGDILKRRRGMHRRFDQFFDDDFFAQNDPFEEMRKMRKEMQQRMKGLAGDQNSDNPFDSWFSDRFGGGSADDVRERHEDDAVYLDIRVPGLSKDSAVSTRVEGHQVILEGTIDKKSQEGGMQSEYKSTFNRSLPLPEKVDATKMEMTLTDGKITLKFPREKTQ